MTEGTFTIAPPVHGGQLRQIALRFGIPSSSLLDFSANLHPGGPPSCVLETLRNAIAHPEVLRNYPDLDLAELRSSLANYVGVAPANVLIANGMAPLLDATLRALSIRKCLLPLPAFAEYQKTLDHCGLQVSPFVLSPERNFSIHSEDILAALTHEQCDALLLANPQNPSGVLLPANDLLALIVAAQQRGIRVLLDEAFIDYLPEQSVTAYAQNLGNLVIFRSVTKFFALAGMRVAYAIAMENTCAQVEPFIPSWPVSTLAAIATCSALEDVRYRRKAIVENEVARNQLYLDLVEAGFEVYPGRANYLLLRLPPDQKSAHVWEELIVHHGIVVRNCENFQGLDDRFLRVAVRSSEDNSRLVLALKSLGASAGFES